MKAAKPPVCRLCRKKLIAFNTRVPRVSVVSELKNKELLVDPKRKSVRIYDIFQELGTTLVIQDNVSDLSCMSCARQAVRCLYTLNTLTKYETKYESHQSATSPDRSAKRIVAGSPSGISPLVKRAKVNGDVQADIPTQPRSRARKSINFEQIIHEEEEPNERPLNSDESMKAQMNFSPTRTKVKIFVGFKSGKVIEHECDNREEFKAMKNIATKNYVAAAKALCECKALKQHILAETMIQTMKEVVDYSKSPDCKLKATTADVKNFTNAGLYNSLCKHCPMLAKMLVAICNSGKPEMVKKTVSEKPSGSEEEVDLCTRNAICAAASICMKNYNQELSAYHYRNGLLLLHGGLKALALERCSHLGLSISHSSCIRMQSKLGTGFNDKVLPWKENTKEKELTIRYLKQVMEKQQTNTDGFNLAYEVVHDYSYYDENIHQNVSRLLQRDQETDTVMPEKDLIVSAKDIEVIIKIRKEMVHFKLVADNVDFTVQARHQTKSSQNKSLHWLHAFGVRNRVKPKEDLCYAEPQGRIGNLEVGEILPSKDDLQQIYQHFVPLVYRVIVKNMPAYHSFKPGIEYHIPHHFSKEMQQKSDQCLLGLQFLDPNKSADMADILKEFQEKYVARKEEEILHPTIMHGDQLTEERARNVQWTYHMCESDYERLEGIEPTFSEFHLKMCLFEVSNKIFVKEESAGERGTSFAEMNRSGSSNAKRGPTKDYNAYKDFHESETSAHILAAWAEFSGMGSVLGNPQRQRIPDESVYWDIQTKKEWLHKQIEQFLKKYVFQYTSEKLEAMQVSVSELDELERNGFPCRECGQKFKYHSTRVNHERRMHNHIAEPAETQGEMDEFGYYVCRHKCGNTYKTKQGRNRHERQTHTSNDQAMNDDKPNTQEDAKSDLKHEKLDCVNNYHIARLSFGLIIMLFTDAVKEGDAHRLLLCLKTVLLILHTYQRVKYSYVLLLFLAKIKCILSSGMAFEVLNNRFFDTNGQPGGNIPLDLRMEHLNKLLKTALKQLGSNVTENGAQRIALGLQGLERIIENVHSDTTLQKKVGHHSSKHLNDTILTITEDLIHENVVKEIPGRKYENFKKAQKNILEKLDYREFFRWVKRLFSVWDAMYN